MDERVRSEYRKIYSELMMFIMIFCAGSLLVKFNVCRMELSGCMTEFLILVGSPVYLAIRQWMLGLNPNEAVPRKRRVLSFAAAVVCATAAFLLSALYRNGGVTGDVAVNLLVFIAMFTFVFYVSRKVTGYFAEKKSREYEEK